MVCIKIFIIFSSLNCLQFILHILWPTKYFSQLTQTFYSFLHMFVKILDLVLTFSIRAPHHWLHITDSHHITAFILRRIRPLCTRYTPQQLQKFGCFKICISEVFSSCWAVIRIKLASSKLFDCRPFLQQKITKQWLLGGCGPGGGSTLTFLYAFF